MIRFLYTLLLRLHPRFFRQRFGGEMLWIFDQQERILSRKALLGDAFLSVIRQWAKRSAYRERPGLGGALGRGPHGIPAFYTFGRSAPRGVALLNGVWVSAAVFSLAAFLIAHGGTSGLIRLPRVVLPSLDVDPSVAAGRRPSRTSSEASSGGPAHRPQQSAEAGPYLEPRRGAGPPAHGSEGPVPDVREPSTYSFPLDRRIAKAAAEPRHQDPAALRAARLLAWLDQDGDGKISREERRDEGSRQFRELLDRADRDQDGIVTFFELQNALRAVAKAANH